MSVVYTCNTCTYLNTRILSVKLTALTFATAFCTEPPEVTLSNSVLLRRISCQHIVHRTVILCSERHIDRFSVEHCRVVVVTNSVVSIAPVSLVSSENRHSVDRNYVEYCLAGYRDYGSFSEVN